MHRSHLLLTFFVATALGCSSSHVPEGDAAIRTDAGAGRDAAVTCGSELCSGSELCCAGCPGRPPLGCFAGGCPPIACPAEWTTCEAALAGGATGQGCSFEGSCEVDEGCCARIARCEGRSLIVEQTCAPGCFVCASNHDCDPTQFCDASLDGCGGPGTCTARPTACDADCPGVCGCDGTTYCNACEANVAGVTVARESACDEPGCEAQDARGVGGCALFLGVMWNGSACQGFGGCSCEGADCGAIYESPEDCEFAHSMCVHTRE